MNDIRNITRADINERYYSCYLEYNKTDTVDKYYG